MTVLAVEASANVASAAIVTKDKTVAEAAVNNKRTHSETLLPMIDYLFKVSQLTLKDITHIAVTTGPGSFTGIRIGAATAKAIARGAGLPIIGVPTLDALAYNVFAENMIIVPVMDARRAQVYTCFYKREALRLTRLSAYEALNINECLEKAKGYGCGVVFLGDGAAAFENEIKGYSANFVIAPPNNNMQRASSIGLYALYNSGETKRYDELEIFYLRKPQAEREYEMRRACIK